MVYSYECRETENKCKFRKSRIFELRRELKDRNLPAPCPYCGSKKTVKVIVEVRFNEVFPGSERAESLNDKAIAESVIAQNEGFRSPMEMETAVGQAHERAKQLGIPVNRILGGHKSPFVGERYKPDQGSQDAYNKAAEGKLKASLARDGQAIVRANRELKAVQSEMKKKAQAHQSKMEFKPDRSKDDLKKACIQAQKARKFV